MSRTEHMDVAAYALGVLDEQDTERFEEHLATCWACAAELETMVPVVGLLSDIDGETMTAMEQTATDPRLLDRTLVAVRAHRRRQRFRQVLTAAAAVVVFGGLTGVGIASVSDGGGQQVIAEPTTNASVDPPPNPTVSGPGLGGPNPIEGEPFAATDPTTGVAATFYIADKKYGTQVNFVMDKLPGPRTCRLVVVRRDGKTEVISSWSVPPGGYGTNSNSEKLVLGASTFATRDDIARLQVQSVDVNGVATPLVAAKL
ncbi:MULTISPECIES: anti-sigma factor family protein [Micromonospora]|uniref:Putative zinc-finger n=1 Tax=Micromonospora yangpuensis TaxID=683228 RepID=A0A1C6UDW3_9ACTN|nr:zf-HC2 domain-containing protein [Micromonospora yangpuensis]GGM27278.1 RNA polymerase subunit sigma [Micromonospora yangpuensis]SCL52226.1 Putative zinc-finger [Micromonospora yangpuensis]